MKKRLLLTAILCVLCSCLFFGCSKNLTRKDLEKQYADCITVNFDIGDGGMISGQDKITLYYYYSRGADNKAQIVEPGKGSLNKVELSKSGHFLYGWYSDPEFKNRWDFNSRVENDITLYAKWLPRFKYSFYYLDEATGNETALQTKNSENSEPTPVEMQVEQGGVLRESSISSRITREGYTLLGLYKDLQCTQPWDYSFTHPGTIQNDESVGTSCKVYTKWLQGNYTLVRSPSDISGITADGNYYLLADIDFSQPDGGGNYYKWGGADVEFGGTIIGNGFAIKGAKASFPLFGSRSNDWGLFKKLVNGARLDNVRFENAEVEINDTATVPRSIGLLCGTAERDVYFDNVSLNGKLTFISSPRPEGCNIGFAVGDLECSARGLTFAVDCDSRLDNYVWHADETDPLGNELVFTAKQTAAA